MTFDLTLAVASILVISVILYALSGGADFGSGIWDLFAFGKRAKDQRDAITDSISAIWEANHVWLILIIVLLFTAFPKSFSTIMTGLFIPMFLILIGIVLRGVAFVFRKYDSQRDQVHRFWSALFGVSSFLTPFLLGLCLGALATGEISSLTLTNPWAVFSNKFAIACGLFSQGLFSYLAAVYLAADHHDKPELQNDFRTRAIYSALSLAPAAALVFFVAKDGAPYLFSNLNASWAPILLLATSITAISSLLSLFFRRFAIARLLAAAQVALIILGWALAQYPYIVVPEISIYNSSASEATLKPLLIILGIGMLTLFPALAYLIYIFKKN